MVITISCLTEFFFCQQKKKSTHKTGGQILNCFMIEPGTKVFRRLVTQQTIKHSLIYSQHVLQVNASVLTFSLFSVWNDPLSILWSSLFWLKKKFMVLCISTKSTYVSTKSTYGKKYISFKIMLENYVLIDKTNLPLAKGENLIIQLVCYYLPLYENKNLNDHYGN